MTDEEMEQLIGGVYMQIEIQFDEYNQVNSTSISYDLPQKCVDVFNYTDIEQY